MHFLMSFIHKYVSPVCQRTHKVSENTTLSLFFRALITGVQRSWSRFASLTNTNTDYVLNSGLSMPFHTSNTNALLEVWPEKRVISWDHENPAPMQGKAYWSSTQNMCHGQHVFFKRAWRWQWSSLVWRKNIYSNRIGVVFDNAKNTILLTCTFLGSYLHVVPLLCYVYIT